MRPEPLAVGFGVMVGVVASVPILHEAGYMEAGAVVLLASLLAGGLITVLGRAQTN